MSREEMQGKSHQDKRGNKSKREKIPIEEREEQEGHIFGKKSKEENEGFLVYC
jgi:hypothetical protein